MSVFTQFVSGNIKSIQRGTLSFGTSSTASATITTVNTDKSILFNLGMQGSGTTFDRGSGRISLENSTTISAVRFGDTSNGNISYQLVEYY
jgi:hypothetical protein